MFEEEKCLMKGKFIREFFFFLMNIIFFPLFSQNLHIIGMNREWICIRVKFGQQLNLGNIITPQK